MENVGGKEEVEVVGGKEEAGLQLIRDVLSKKLCVMELGMCDKIGYRTSSKKPQKEKKKKNTREERKRKREKKGEAAAQAADNKVPLRYTLLYPTQPCNLNNPNHCPYYPYYLYCALLLLKVSNTP